MRSSKLKSLILLILVLVNGFLLILVVPSRLAAHRQTKQSDALLAQLYGQAGITLEITEMPQTLSVTQCALEIREDALLQAAKALLGQNAEVQVSQFGSDIRSPIGDGYFYGNYLTLTLSQACEDPDAFVEAQLAAMGAGEHRLRQQESEGDIRIVATFLLEGLDLRERELTFRFQDGLLTEVTGFFFPAHMSFSPTKTQACMAARDALVRLLDHLQKEEASVTTVQSLAQAWRIPSFMGAETTVLVPVWAIQTDAGVYLVDGLTSDVIPPA